MNYHGLTYLDIENGIGLRVTLWVSGCTLRCKGCHNPETWDFNSGVKFDDNAKNTLFNILKLEYVDGVTFSGGNPLDNACEISLLSKEIHEKFPTKTQWLYSGYTLAEIKENPEMLNALKYIDVLVDGRFEIQQRDTTLAFRGSNNQNIINVKEVIPKCI